MNTQFFDKTQTVNVSRVTREGWWLENTTEQVVKGTALGSDFTTNIYQPSTPKMIARYDRKTDTWSDEIQNKSDVMYFDEHGRSFLIGSPDGEHPDWAITEVPPEYDTSKQTVLYKDHCWRIYDILVGQPYYDQWGNEFIVSDYNFEPPQGHTLTPPPEPKEGHAIQLVNGHWVELIDYRDKTIYRHSDCTQSKVVTELGAIEEGWTEKEPSTQFDEWINDDWITNLSNQYIYGYDQVDNTRRALYAQCCDPLIAEANIKRLQGHEAEAQELEAQALAVREKIQIENPFPLAPTEE
ncbi:hypothetical protein TW81_09770 [Vibrio galatheae]|uniref:Uncharacterized protein n=1 Tax=Vibrio galatheae TaxID=579748 RepID=A0A0F4NMG0_9VIBR|nr:hypothetical protein [Vibrio galatheae]KJY83281.1 hypothetical protein TW81_09770 [Vibrio galatheae]